MSERRAPTALRMPISRVRSVTLTSMMFITPIPPTSSEIAATSPSSVVNTPLVELEVSSSEPWLSTLKPGSAVSLIRWRSSRIVVTSASAASSEDSDFACTVIESIGPTPVSASCTVVIGAITTSSSLVVPLVPFLASTPTTS
jgi:hypothetical protein